MGKESLAIRAGARWFFRRNSPQAAQGRSGVGIGIARAGRQTESRRSLELAARARPGEEWSIIARSEEEMGRGASAPLRQQICRFRPGDSFSHDPDGGRRERAE